MQATIAIAQTEIIHVHEITTRKRQGTLTVLREVDTDMELVFAKGRVSQRRMYEIYLKNRIEQLESSVDNFRDLLSCQN